MQQEFVFARGYCKI